jgi:dihydrofolate reductase
MSDTGIRNGNVVVNRAMSLDGFIAGPSHSMDSILSCVSPDEFPEIMAATGAMLAGRRTYEVGKRDAGTGKASGEAYGGAWSGPQFVLTHQPPEDSADRPVTFLSGDIEAAVDTARKAAGGKNVEILGTDVARQALQRGLVDEVLVHVVPVLLGDGIPFSSPGLGRIDLEPISTTRSGSVTTLRFRVRK